MEEKASLDILEHMRTKYDFEYEDDKILELAKAMKVIVDDVSQLPDWAGRDDIKASLTVKLIMLLHEYGFPPIINDDVYKGVLEQAKIIRKVQVNER